MEDRYTNHSQTSHKLYMFHFVVLSQLTTHSSESDVTRGVWIYENAHKIILYTKEENRERSK